MPPRAAYVCAGPPGCEIHMKVVLQRVCRASVRIGGRDVSRIEKGLLLLVAVEQGDQTAQADYLSAKIAKMRIFEDSDGKMNRSVLDVRGEVLAVSQFTLAADWRKGNRPSFTGAAEPAEALRLFDYFTDRIRNKGVITVRKGCFGEHMEVELVNDGPVTIVMSDS